MSETLVKDRDVIVYRNEASYCVIGVPELLQNGDMVCVLQEQACRKYRSHYDLSARIVLLRSHDNGSTWDPGTKTLVADAESEAVVGPAIKQLRDGTLIVTYFKWRMGNDDEVPAEQPSEDEGAGMHFANSAGGDNLGYPTSVQLPDGTVFTTWYMNEAEGQDGSGFSPLSYIGGTFLRER